MKTRTIDTLQAMGYIGDLATFRKILISVKAELFPELTDEDLAYSRHQAEDYCIEVRKRAECKKLPRVFILRNLVNCRKNGMVKKK